MSHDSARPARCGSLVRRFRAGQRCRGARAVGRRTERVAAGGAGRERRRAAAAPARRRRRARGRPRAPAAGPWAGDLRARQRLEPLQRPQPRRRRGAQRRRLRDAAVRPADRATRHGIASWSSTSRCWPAGSSCVTRWALDGAVDRPAADRLLRGVDRRCGGAACGGRGRRCGRRGRFAWRPPRPGRRSSGTRARRDAAARRQQRRAGARAQPPRRRDAALPAPARRRRGRRPPLRGAGHAGRRRPCRDRVVRRAPAHRDAAPSRPPGA